VKTNKVENNEKEVKTNKVENNEKEVKTKKGLIQL
jgi:hypothetical protein